MTHTYIPRAACTTVYTCLCVIHRAPCHRHSHQHILAEALGRHSGIPCYIHIDIHTFLQILTYLPSLLLSPFSLYGPTPLNRHTQDLNQCLLILNSRLFSRTLRPDLNNKLKSKSGSISSSFLILRPFLFRGVNIVLLLGNSHWERLGVFRGNHTMKKKKKNHID